VFPSPRLLSCKERVITLTSDTIFFTILVTALQSLTSQEYNIQTNFNFSLQKLADSISQSVHPVSSSPNRLLPFRNSVQDLYVWRQIFTTYMELEVFESTGECDRGERDIPAAVKRLQLFNERVLEIGLKLSASGRHTLERFLQLNSHILDLKRFHHANSEATRKILKKHAKRTALPALPINSMVKIYPSSRRDGLSLPHILVLSISQILLPILPHIADYECLICTGLAFKPIRLDCGHFFCVRCLVKMQKSGKGNCPVCRSPTVLRANGRNVDQALMRFMRDWFPRESKEKAKSNGREAATEELQDLGFQVPDGCLLQ